ncbi:MAG: DUF481 domain-containing protein [Burkholderiales bacterium]|nr:DUF481 domain-containing protein [Burkholderiales bacterium]
MSSHSLIGARLCGLAIACALPFAIGTTSSFADTITLHNGDRLTGRILHSSPDVLTFETTWAGELQIRRAEVSAIETDKPVTVLRDGAPATEELMLLPSEPGQAQIGSEPQDESRSSAAAEGQELPLAQIRYINPKPEESGEGVSHEGRLTLSSSLVRGNSVAERIYAESDLNARAIDWRYALTAKYRHEADANGTTAANWLLSGNYDHFIDSTTHFGYLRSSLERDRFRDIQLRATVGGGYGRQLLQTERTQLSLRGGIEAVDLRRYVERDEAYPAFGWGLNVTHRIEAVSAELFHDQQGFLNLVDAGQLTIRSRTGVRVPFASGLTASLQLNLDWEREPAAGRRPTDATWLLGLGYAW